MEEVPKKSHHNPAKSQTPFLNTDRDQIGARAILENADRLDAGDNLIQHRHIARRERGRGERRDRRAGHRRLRRSRRLRGRRRDAIEARASG